MELVQQGLRIGVGIELGPEFCRRSLAGVLQPLACGSLLADALSMLRHHVVCPGFQHDMADPTVETREPFLPKMTMPLDWAALLVCIDLACAARIFSVRCHGLAVSFRLPWMLDARALGEDFASKTGARLLPAGALRSKVIFL